jgi:adenylate kinase
LRTIEANDDILEHKLINRAYAAAFSARSSCLLRIIQNNTGEFERAVEEFVSTIRFIGVDKYTLAAKAKTAAEKTEKA